jgi:hypothetical protein
MAEILTELAASVLWMFKEAGWSDKQYDELIANIAYYLTYAYKA